MDKNTSDVVVGQEYNFYIVSNGGNEDMTVRVLSDKPDSPFYLVKGKYDREVFLIRKTAVAMVADIDPEKEEEEQTEEEAEDDSDEVRVVRSTSFRGSNRNKHNEDTTGLVVVIIAAIIVGLGISKLAGVW